MTGFLSARIGEVHHIDGAVLDHEACLSNASGGGASPRAEIPKDLVHRSELTDDAGVPGWGLDDGTNSLVHQSLDAGFCTR